MQLGDNVSATVPLVKITRGDVVEVVHRGALAVVDSGGRLVAHAGDPDLTVIMRSSAKPFQLLPLVESGTVDRMGFSEHELAVMTASHSGSDMHIETVAGVLDHLNADGLGGPGEPRTGGQQKSRQQTASAAASGTNIPAKLKAAVAHHENSFLLSIPQHRHSPPPSLPRCP